MRRHSKVLKNWGYEECFENNEKYCGKFMVVGNRWSSNGKFHYHKLKDETFYVLEGTLQLQIKNGDSVMDHQIVEGASFRVMPMNRHRFRAVGKLCKFIEVSTHHDDSDSYYD